MLHRRDRLWEREVFMRRPILLPVGRVNLVSEAGVDVARGPFRDYSVSYVSL